MHGPKRRRNLLVVVALAAATALGTVTPRPLTAGLAASGTISASLGTCTVDGLLMTNACPTGTMSVTPGPGLVNASERFTVVAAYSPTIALPPNATTTWGKTVGLPCTTACNITWVPDTGSTVIIDFTKQTAATQSDFDTASCGVTAHSYQPTDSCVTADSSDATGCPSACTWTFTHSYGTTGTYRPFFVLGFHATMPYTVGTPSTTPFTYQTLIQPAATYTNASSSTWQADSVSSSSNSFTNYVVQDNWSNHTVAGGQSSAGGNWTTTSLAIQSVCHSCGALDSGGDDTKTVFSGCKDQPWQYEAGESDKTKYSGWGGNGCKAQGDCDDCTYSTSSSSSNDSYVYTSGYIDVINNYYSASPNYPPQTVSYDSQSLAPVGGSYVSSSKSGGPWETRWNTFASAYPNSPFPYTTTQNHTYTPGPGEITGYGGGCSDPNNLSDYADWVPSHASLLPACTPYFGSGPLTLVTTAPASYDTWGLNTLSQTSYVPTSVTEDNQTISPGSGTYRTAWLSYGGSVLGGFSSSTYHVSHNPNNCNYGSATSDNDQGDGDGSGWMNWRISCAAVSWSSPSSPWFYTPSSVNYSTQSFTNYRVTDNYYTATLPSQTTVTYYSPVATTGYYNACSPCTKTTVATTQSVPWDAGGQLTLVVNQEEPVQR